MLGLLTYLAWLAGVIPCHEDWNNVQVQPDFLFDQYMGVWYEVSYLDPEEPPGSPWIMDNLYYTYNRTGANNAHATMVGNMRKPADSPCFHRDGKGYMQLDADPKDNAKMIYKISRSGKFPDSHYYVLSTDYSTYALVLQCPVPKLKHGFCEGGSKFNVLSRQKSLLREAEEAIRELLEDKFCVKYDDFMEIRFNKDC